MTDQPYTPSKHLVGYAYVRTNAIKAPEHELWDEYHGFIAAIEAAAEQRGNLDGWDEALELLENNSEIDQDAVDHYKSLNPNRINRADRIANKENE